MDLITVLKGSAFCAGLTMGAASVMSIGPNTLTLVREGALRGRVGLVSSLFLASYLALLTSALILGEKIAARGEMIRPLLSWLGLTALCWFAFSSLRAYFKASTAIASEPSRRETTIRCVRRVLCTVWCNPLTYVELLIVPAAISCSFMMPACRWLFIVGLFLMKAAGCYGYSFGGVVVGPYLRRRSTLKMLDLGSGVIMSALAMVMAAGLLMHP